MGVALGLAAFASSVRADEAPGLVLTPSGPQEQTVVEGRWREPVFTEQRFDFTVDLPLSEAIKNLRKQTKEAFDVIWARENGIDPLDVPVQSQLKNVSVVEVFQALNLQFELNSNPIRWSLIMNGERPTAILKVRPVTAKSPIANKRTAVVYVGDLITTRGSTNYSFEREIEKITGAIEAVADQSGSGSISVKAYPAGELIIVSGTDEQLSLVREVIAALSQKAAHEQGYGPRFPAPMRAPVRPPLTAPAPNPPAPIAPSLPPQPAQEN